MPDRVVMDLRIELEKEGDGWSVVKKPASIHPFPTEEEYYNQLSESEKYAYVYIKTMEDQIGKMVDRDYLYELRDQHYYYRKLKKMVALLIGLISVSFLLNLAIELLRIYDK